MCSSNVEMVMLYHATTDELEIGEKLRADTRNPASIANASRREAEEFLKQQCPKGRPQRLSSFFAFDDPSHSAAYLDSELRCGLKQGSNTGQRHLYIVEMSTFSKHPMILVDAVATSLSQGDESLAAKLAEEYWDPTQEWKFWEHLAPEMVVVERMSWPNETALVRAYLAYTMGEANKRGNFLNRLRRG